MKLYNNPAIFLTRKMWEYSKGNRKQVVLYVSLSVLANIVWNLDPLIVGWVLNIVQEHGFSSEGIRSVVLPLSLLIAIVIVGWSLHGPSRVTEESNAFLVRKNYKKYLLSGTMHLSADWHSNHHSGDTIDKIEKGTRSLFEFSENSYELIDAIIRLTLSYIALTVFNPHSGYIVFLLSMSSYIPITWPRYLFPLLPPLVLIQSYSLIKTVEWVKLHIRRKVQ